MKVKPVSIILLLLLTSPLLLLRLPRQASPMNRPIVITTLYPWAYFTSEIGDQNITVVNLVPSGTEPHDYEPTPRDIARISQSKLLILNGAQLEPWAENNNSLPNSTRLILTDKTSRLLRLEPSNQPDPHIWLDPMLAVEAVEQIAAALVQLDPPNAENYLSNARNLTSQLQQLHADFSQNLQNCKLRDIITSHNAFGYLASRYTFTQLPIAGVSPDQEPSPYTIAQLTKLVKSKKIKYIFFETLSSPKLARTIANEVGVTTLPLNPLEGLTKEESDRGEDYFSLQMQNLQNLKTAMECS